MLRFAVSLVDFYKTMVTMTEPVGSNRFLHFSLPIHCVDDYDQNRIA